MRTSPVGVGEWDREVQRRGRGVEALVALVERQQVERAGRGDELEGRRHGHRRRPRPPAAAWGSYGRGVGGSAGRASGRTPATGAPRRAEMGGTYAPVGGYSSSSSKPIIPARASRRAWPTCSPCSSSRAPASPRLQTGLLQRLRSRTRPWSPRARSETAGVRRRGGHLRGSHAQLRGEHSRGVARVRRRVAAERVVVRGGLPTWRRRRGGHLRAVVEEEDQSYVCCCCCVSCVSPRASVPLTPFSRRRVRVEGRRDSRTQAAPPARATSSRKSPRRESPAREAPQATPHRSRPRCRRRFRTTRTRSDQTATRPRYPKKNPPVELSSPPSVLGMQIFQIFVGSVRLLRAPPCACALSSYPPPLGSPRHARRTRCQIGAAGRDARRWCSMCATSAIAAPRAPAPPALVCT